MNEIETIKQLPDNLENLTQFVLVGKAKLQAYMLKLQTVNKLSVAQEIRDQTLKETQEISNALIAAEQRIGELLLAIPKKSGGDRKSEDFKNGDSANFEKGKSEVASEMGYTHNDVRDYQQMAKNPEIVQRVIQDALANGEVVTKSQVLKAIKTNEKEKKRQEREEHVQSQLEEPHSENYVDITETPKKYRVIYADPPWSYGDKQNIDGLGGAVKHYPTMPLDDICDIDIPSEDNAVLFLWTTSPMLEDSFKVINSWGFKYKSSFVWDKIAHNMGHYNSVRHEFLLIATKGSCTPDVPKLFDSVVSVERTRHSEKPDVFREIIDTLYPRGNRIELFSRKAVEGWDVWGNMV